MSNPRRAAASGPNSNPALKSGDGDGTFDAMQTCVKALEADVSEIKGDLKTILRELAEIKGKLSNMPATWQIVAIVVTMLALVIASGGAMMAFLRYAGM